MAKHLTDAAHAWMTKAEARGYSEAECITTLMQAHYEHHNQLPLLPKAKSEYFSETERVVQFDSVAAVGLENFHYLISGLQGATDLSETNAALAIAGSSKAYERDGCAFT